jgi:hypothetical protein
MLSCARILMRYAQRYNTNMASITVHVFPSDGTWVVKSEGKPGTSFATQRAAIQAARKSIRTEKGGQYVVHGTDGRLKGRGVYRMPRVQDPPRKSPRADEIERVVSKIALSRVQADDTREHSAKK